MAKGRISLPVKITPVKRTKEKGSSSKNSERTKRFKDDNGDYRIYI